MKTRFKTEAGDGKAYAERFRFNAQMSNWMGYVVYCATICVRKEWLFTPQSQIWGGWTFLKGNRTGRLAFVDGRCNTKSYKYFSSLDHRLRWCVVDLLTESEGAAWSLKQWVFWNLDFALAVFVDRANKFGRERAIRDSCRPRRPRWMCMSACSVLRWIYKFPIVQKSSPWKRFVRYSLFVMSRIDDPKWTELRSTDNVRTGQGRWYQD